MLSMLVANLSNGLRFIPTKSDASAEDAMELALSPQCGFASVAEGGNHLTEEEQFAKLRLVADTARALWGSAG